MTTKFDPLKGKSHIQQTAWRYPTEVHQSIHWNKRNTTETLDGISYEYNNYGFRNPNLQEFYYAHSPIAVGCSITLGVGVELNQTWHSQIHEGCNLGQSGGTVETMYRLLQYWLPKIKPVRVRVLAPPRGRREIWVKDNHAIQFTPSSQETVFPQLLSTETEIRINADRMKSAIIYLCTSNDIPCTYVEWEDIAHVCNDYGADGLHPGVDSHKAIAKHFIDMHNV